MSKKFAYPILIILILLTAFQSFMLINYHSTGRLLPKRVITGPNTVTDVMNFEEYLLETFILPFEITMTTGEGLNVHKITNESDGYYNQIWKNTVTLLGTIADMKLYEIYDADKWNEMTGKSGYIIKLGYDCPIEFINWISGSVNTNNEIKSMNKVMILPTASDEGDAYIKSDDKVYRYIGVKLSGLLQQDKFLSIYEEIKQASEITYVYLNEVASYDNFKGNIEPDTTVVIMNNRAAIGSIRVVGYELLTECMFNLQIEPDINNLSASVTQYISEIKSRLFGVYSDVYKVLIAQNRDLTFSDQYNIYSIHSDGSITYRYLSASYIQEKGEISQAFNNALGMLTDLATLSGAVQNKLLLTSVEVLNDSYQFNFTYYFNGYPVLLKEERNCISINATADRVISVDANLFDISDASLPNDEEDMYDLRTFNMLSERDMVLGSIKADSMYIAYVKDVNTVLLPRWIIEADEITVLELKEAED